MVHQVIVTDSNNNTFQFIEDGNSGIYKNNSFIPVINDIYIFNILIIMVKFIQQQKH